MERDAVPVTLLTGFLGAGKTTVLNRILNDDHGLRVGVLVNDFGAINIDAELVEAVEENAISLTNGCVCCEIRDDLVDSIEQLLSRTEPIEYVLVEASGIADPEGIVMTFLDPRYQGLIRLDSVTCVIDAEAIFADGDNDALSALKLRQIAFADLVILNKVDLVGPEHVEVIRDWINAHLQRIRIIEAARGNAPLEALMSVGRFDAEHLDTAIRTLPDAARPATSVDKAAHHHFESWSFESAQSFSLAALRTMVRRQLPATVYRCKGIVHAQETPETRFALQVVGRRTEICELDGWNERAPRSHIVAIGDGIDPGELTQLFEACLTRDAAPAERTA